MITEEIIRKVDEWLGEEGRVAYTRELLIHENWIHLHFSVGMQVRNFLRSTGLCEEWSPIDLDDNWIRVIEKVLEEDYTNEEFKSGSIYREG